MLPSQRESTSTDRTHHLKKLFAYCLPTLFCLLLLSATPKLEASEPVIVGSDPVVTVLQTIEGKGNEPTGNVLEYYKDAKGYLAVPSRTGKFGSIILIHEWDGVVERIQQVADALANEGYIALAADLYSGRTGTNAQENIALMREARANPDEIIANLNAAATYLRDRSDTTGQIATVGWCFGGGVALSFAIGGEHHDGTAIFYGQLLNDPKELAKIQHEMLGTFAGRDQMIPIQQVNSFARALKNVGVANDIHIYDHVEHGFWLYVERNLEVNREPAKHAWDRLRNFFERVLDDDE